MARSTRGDELVPADEIPAGMKSFTVVDRTIKDSTGAYCAHGQQALLTKKDATRYHKMNLIQVALPDDFGDQSKPSVPAVEKAHAVVEPAADAGAETPADAGTPVGEAVAEPAADSGGGRTSRRV